MEWNKIRPHLHMGRFHHCDHLAAEGRGQLRHLPNWSVVDLVKGNRGYVDLPAGTISDNDMVRLSYHVGLRGSVRTT